MRFQLYCAGAALAFATLIGGCAEKKPSLEEQQRLEAARQEALKQLEKLQSGTSSPTEIPGLSNEPAGLAARPRPEWTGMGIPAEYPGGKYITGVGSAERGAAGDYKALATAEDRARAAVAQTIRVRIQSEFENAAKLVTEASGGTVVSQQERNETTDRIKARVDVQLEGAHIVDRWYDPQTGTYWALAALERVTAGRRLADRMDQARQQVQSDRQLGLTFQEQKQPVQAVAYLQRAARSVYTVLNLRAQLNAIAPEMLQGLSVEEMHIPEVLKEADLALKALRIKLVVFADAGELKVAPTEAADQIAQTLRGLGMKVSPMPPPADMTYESQVKRPLEAMRQAAPDTDLFIMARLSAKQVSERKLQTLLMHFYQAKGSAEVDNLSDGGVLTSASFDWLDKSHSASADAQRAAEEAMHLAAKELADRLRIGFIQALNLPAR